ncbi:carbohydrate ABC transporter permease [Naasia sp. SYSU D00057]|uniref:carbohydrate ABC transporter permease n=1 Tax=Naasia sp. SYSU D00057 TaxID=2817380 RepID=UPI001B313E40|nr:carbohydrate ABC transporter permease [Naasia sp. SYSU D00057]
MTRTHRLGVTARMIAVLVVLGLAVFPVYWMLVTALTSDEALFGGGLTLLPDLSRLGVFGDALQDGEVVRWLLNSLIIASGTTVLSIALGVPLAYALSRFRFAGKAALGLALLFTQMLPEALLVVPLFAIFRRVDLLNSLHGLVLANTAFVLPVVALILKGAIDGVPRELDEATRVDGGRPPTVLLRVILPLIGPSIAAAAVIAFFHAWNEYVFAVTFIFDKSLQPASVGVAGFIGEQDTSIQSIMSVAVLFTLPAVAFYLFAQKYVVGGMTAGAVKG